MKQNREIDSFTSKKCFLYIYLSLFDFYFLGLFFFLRKYGNPPDQALEMSPTYIFLQALTDFLGPFYKDYYISPSYSFNRKLYKYIFTLLLKLATSFFLKLNFCLTLWFSCFQANPDPWRLDYLYWLLSPVPSP